MPDLVLESEHDALEVRTESLVQYIFGDLREGCVHRNTGVDERHVQGSEGRQGGLDDPAIVVILARRWSKSPRQSK